MESMLSAVSSGCANPMTGSNWHSNNAEAILSPIIGSPAPV
jgi:hypothetical protein